MTGKTLFELKLSSSEKSGQSGLQEDCSKKEKAQTTFISYLRFLLAESEGFEPPEPHSSIVFKTTAIDHSANSPRQK